jgi:hypothetical protein
MIRRVLFFMVICVTSYAQDTLGVIDSKYKAKDQEVFLHGDSAFIRLIYANYSIQGSEAGWYRNGEKIGEVNLKVLTSRKMLGVQADGDTVYYYGYTEQGRKTTVITLRSVGSGEPEKIGEQTLRGGFILAKERGKNLSVVTLDRKEKKVIVYDIQKGISAMAGELVYNWNIEDELLNPSIDVYLDGNMLAAVLDDRHPNPGDPRAFRRTLILRKDLVTGKSDTDGFRVADEPGRDKGLFRSALNGNLLYRLLPTKDDWKIVVQDLDSNKVVYQLDLPAVEASYVHTADDPVRPRKLDDAVSDYRKDAVDVGIEVENFGSRKTISVRFTTYAAAKVHAVGALTGIGPAAHVYYVIVTNQMIGSIAEGFAPARTTDVTAEILSEEFRRAYPNAGTSATWLHGENYRICVLPLDVNASGHVFFLKFTSKP